MLRNNLVKISFVFLTTIIICFAFPQINDRFAFPDESSFDSNPNTNNNNNINNNNNAGTDGTIDGVPVQQTEAFFTCTRNCLTTPEYNPVCGSDAQSYNNERRLDCANRCGTQLSRNFQLITTRTRGTCPPPTSG